MADDPHTAHTSVLGGKQTVVAQGLRTSDTTQRQHAPKVASALNNCPAVWVVLTCTVVHVSAYSRFKHPDRRTWPRDVTLEQNQVNVMCKWIATRHACRQKPNPTCEVQVELLWRPNCQVTVSQMVGHAVFNSTYCRLASFHRTHPQWSAAALLSMARQGKNWLDWPWNCTQKATTIFDYSCHISPKFRILFVCWCTSMNFFWNARKFHKHVPFLNAFPHFLHACGPPKNGRAVLCVWSGEPHQAAECTKRRLGEADPKVEDSSWEKSHSEPEIRGNPWKSPPAIKHGKCFFSI